MVQGDKLPLEERLFVLSMQVNALMRSERLSMQDRIINTAKEHIRAGEISEYERQRLNQMRTCYREDLGGDDSVDHLIEIVNELPPKF